jgi:hypothetical protein
MGGLWNDEARRIASEDRRRARDANSPRIRALLCVRLFEGPANEVEMLDGAALEPALEELRDLWHEASDEDIRSEPSRSRPFMWH